MTRFPYLEAARASYDTVAEDYAVLVPPLVDGDTFGRAMLGAFAELVRDAGGLPVADVGCGPGHITARLDGMGLDVFGVDLSPGMVEVARRTYPRLRFDVGSMTGLDLPDGELGGIVAWWSVLHTPPEVLPVVLAEFRRTLAPGGHAVIGFHVGEGSRRPERAYGHPVAYGTYFWQPDRMAELLVEAGLDVVATLVSEGAKRPSAVLMARRAG
ncbi:class I SAM-dependent methyltransferase [Streptomyces sp. NPDC050738]|uniref:class I SAM-dependent methyltransferase n=1 Tax=Streptomyces sp. NPDC050738 TaxID=3154744 RepID=UPI0034343E04